MVWNGKGRAKGVLCFAKWDSSAGTSKAWDRRLSWEGKATMVWNGKGRAKGVLCFAEWDSPAGTSKAWDRRWSWEWKTTMVWNGKGRAKGVLCLAEWDSPAGTSKAWDRRLSWEGKTTMVWNGKGRAKGVFEGIGLSMFEWECDKAQWKGEEDEADRRKWEDNIREWTSLEFAKSQRVQENRGKWSKLVVKASVVPRRPPRLRDRWRWHGKAYKGFRGNGTPRVWEGVWQLEI